MSIDSMHGRNPKSEIYVLNGLPMPHDTVANGYNINNVFRRNLFSTIIIMIGLGCYESPDDLAGRRPGRRLARVDVFTPMAKQPMVDSVYNPAYFYDFIHPNQQGYDLMAKQVFKAMRRASSSFYK